MNDNRWPRGAQWRKWDLHVHSPASHGYSGDYNQFVIQLGNADCDVIGINDYFSVEGYREIQRRLSQPGSDLEGNKATGTRWRNCAARSCSRWSNAG